MGGRERAFLVNLARTVSYSYESGSYESGCNNTRLGLTCVLKRSAWEGNDETFYTTCCLDNLCVRNGR